MPRRVPLVLVASALIVAACSSQSANGQDVTIVDETGNSLQTEPALLPGGIASGQVVIDGVTIDYTTATPAGFVAGDTSPLVLAFPPGGQDADLTRSIVQGTWAPEATRLGWVVVSPAAPEGTLWFQGSESLLPEFVDWVETWVDPEGGGPHVGGISNGGISSFRFAAENPDRVQSIITFPGFPRSESDRDALASLTDVPIRMFVGGNDGPWIEPAQETVDEFSELGGDISLEIFPGEGHVMASTRDGRLIFELLESFR